MPQTATRYFSARDDRDMTMIAPFSEVGHVKSNVVSAVFAPLPVLIKGGSAVGARSNRFGSAIPPPLDLRPKLKTLPQISRYAPLVGNSVVALSPGLMFTDGEKFTGSSRVRIRKPSDPTSRPPILPPGTLGKKQTSPAEAEAEAMPSPEADPAAAVSGAMGTAQKQVEEQERKRVRRTPEDLLIEQVGAGNHDLPGVGINASPSTLAAPQKWESLKDNLKKSLAKTRRASFLMLSGQVEKLLQSPQAGDNQEGLNLAGRTNATKVIQMLNAVTWFRRLSNSELRKLLGRCEIVLFKKGTQILRESTYGSAFYMLIEGAVCCKSESKHIDVALQPGACFGESALATSVHVRREATVTALDDSWCLRMTAKDMLDLPVDLDSLKRIYYAKLLHTVTWFDRLPYLKLEALGRLSELEHIPASRVVFNEGDSSDKMYVLVSGAVGIFKLKGGEAGRETHSVPSVPPPPPPQASAQASAESGAEAGAEAGAESWAERNVMVSQCDEHSKNPWFGEAALFADGRPRVATAFTVAESTLLSIHCKHAAKLQEIIPEFFRMNLAYSSMYKKVNQINGTEKSNFGNLSDVPKPKTKQIITESGKVIDIKS